MDLKGFDHLGVAWSWPEFEEPSGKILRLAHAWASEGKARCGEPWPHRAHPNGRELQYIERYKFAPTRARIAEIRDAEDRAVYLCAVCLECFRLLAITRSEGGGGIGGGPEKKVTTLQLVLKTEIDE